MKLQSRSREFVLNNVFVEPSTNGSKLWVAKGFIGPDEFVYLADQFGYLLDGKLEYLKIGPSSDVSDEFVCLVWFIVQISLKGSHNNFQSVPTRKNYCDVRMITPSVSSFDF
jgi:hypothetical protein